MLCRRSFLLLFAVFRKMLYQCPRQMYLFLCTTGRFAHWRTAFSTASGGSYPHCPQSFPQPVRDFVQKKTPFSRKKPSVSGTISADCLLACGIFRPQAGCGTGAGTAVAYRYLARTAKIRWKPPPGFSARPLTCREPSSASS